MEKKGHKFLLSRRDAKVDNFLSEQKDLSSYPRCLNLVKLLGVVLMIFKK